MTFKAILIVDFVETLVVDLVDRVKIVAADVGFTFLPRPFRNHAAARQRPEQFD